jgi:hypothetical protein
MTERQITEDEFLAAQEAAEEAPWQDERRKDHTEL